MGYFQDGVLDRAMTKFLPQINAINWIAFIWWRTSIL